MHYLSYKSRRICFAYRVGYC